jgi:tRNA(Ile)-lysidine synthetase-like protein
MMALQQLLTKELEPYRERPLILAFSGGGDSLALLHLLRDLDLPVLAAHLDHGLRPESGEQVALLRGWAEGCGAEFLSIQAPVADHAAACGVEAAGRRLRYRWLRQLAAPRQALVLTAHTLEDVAETLLMRLLSGTSPSGLAGPRHRRGQWLLRPLLDAHREDLRAYLRWRNLAWLEDPSNNNPRFLRNWVRLSLLPLLEERNPRVTQALHRLAQSAADLQRWTGRKSKRSPEQLRGAPLEVRFQSWARAWRSAQPSAGARFVRRHFELCEEWLQGGGSRLQLPGGIFVKRAPTGLAFEKKAPPPPGPGETILKLESGSFALDAWGLDLTVEYCPQAELPQPWRADLGITEGLLRIRARRPGDRFGSKKLKSYLTQWGLSPDQKRRLPLLCDSQDQPFWALGYRVRKEYLAPQGQPGWRFHFTPQGSKGRESNIS